MADLELQVKELEARLKTADESQPRQVKGADDKQVAQDICELKQQIQMQAQRLREAALRLEEAETQVIKRIAETRCRKGMLLFN